MIREPVVAGQFYPADPVKLKKDLNKLVVSDSEKMDVFGVVCPHAGYIYSGRVAGSVFSKINVPDTVVILAPNHTGYGTDFSIWPEGSWNTPLGETSIDGDLTDRIVSDCDLVEEDYDAHMHEHSAEVILPFLQYCNPNVKIVVIVVRSRSLDGLKKVGKSISSIVKNFCPETLVVASSDMTHQEPEKSANMKDKIAIDEIVKMDEDGLYREVNSLGITMCGVNPTVSMLVCSKDRGASSASLIKYETSGKTSGDYDHVVGYAGIVVK